MEQPGSPATHSPQTRRPWITIFGGSAAAVLAFMLLCTSSPVALVHTIPTGPFLTASPEAVVAKFRGKGEWSVNARVRYVAPSGASDDRQIVGYPDAERLSIRLSDFADAGWQLADGRYEFTFVPDLSTKKELTATVILDRSPPVIVRPQANGSRIELGDSVELLVGEDTLPLQITDALSFTVSVNGVERTADDSGRLDLQLTDDLLPTFSLDVTDAVGNLQSCQVTVTIDRSPPQIDWPEDLPEVMYQPILTIPFGASDDVEIKSMDCRLNDQPLDVATVSEGRYQVEFEMVPGANRLIVEVKDRVGRASQQSYDVNYTPRNRGDISWTISGESTPTVTAEPQYRVARFEGSTQGTVQVSCRIRLHDDSIERQSSREYALTSGVAAIVLEDFFPQGTEKREGVYQFAFVVDTEDAQQRAPAGTIVFDRTAPMVYRSGAGYRREDGSREPLVSGSELFLETQVLALEIVDASPVELFVNDASPPIPPATTTEGATTFTLNEPPETLKLLARDVAGNVNQLVLTIASDRMPPTIEWLNRPADGATDKRTMTFRFRVVDDRRVADVVATLNESSVEAEKLPGGEYIFPVTLKSGPNVLALSATDTAGRRASSTARVEYRAPTVSPEPPPKLTAAGADASDPERSSPPLPEPAPKSSPRTLVGSGTDADQGTGSPNAEQPAGNSAGPEEVAVSDDGSESGVPNENGVREDGGPPAPVSSGAAPTGLGPLTNPTEATVVNTRVPVVVTVDGRSETWLCPSSVTSVKPVADRIGRFLVTTKTESDVPMALVPGGKIARIGRSEASVIEIPPFLVDCHEVSVSRYLRFKKSSDIGWTPPLGEKFLGDNQPIVAVSWDDAVAFSSWAGMALLTSEEWTCAASWDGEKLRQFPWGDQFFEGGIDLNWLAYPPELSDALRDVSPWGVFGMSSGVREWCADGPADRASHRFVRGGSAVHPRGAAPVSLTPESFFAKATTSAVRATQRNDVGFRCIVRLQPARSSTTTPESSGSETAQATQK